MTKNTERYVYVIKIEKRLGNSSSIETYGSLIEVYGSLKRANKALYNRMMKLLTEGNETKENISKAQQFYIDHGWYSIKDKNNIIENGHIEKHVVY